MIEEQSVKHVRAFDNMDSENRVVINYTTPSELTMNEPWSHVNEVFVHCGGFEFYVDVWNFRILTETRVPVEELLRPTFRAYKLGRAGQREIMLATKFDDQSVKVLFLNRDKSFRVIENTFLKEKIKGSLFTRRNIRLEKLEYIEQI